MRKSPLTRSAFVMGRNLTSRGAHGSAGGQKEVLGKNQNFPYGTPKVRAARAQPASPIYKFASVPSGKVHRDIVARADG